MALSCKLEFARFSALLRIQDGAECGNICLCWCWYTNLLPGHSIKGQEIEFQIFESSVSTCKNVQTRGTAKPSDGCI